MKSPPAGKEFSPVEVVNLAYLLFLSLISVLMLIMKIHPAVVKGLILYLLLILVIIMIHFLRSRNFIRTRYYNLIYLIFIPFVFDSMQYIVPYLFRPMDPVLARIESAVMAGFLPSLYFQHTLAQNALFNTVLIISYVLYFFLPLAVISYHFFSGQRELILKDIFYITLGLYLCYIGYIFVPLFGPRFYYSYETQLAGGKIFNFFISAMNLMERNKLDAFPSAHIEMALIILYLVRKNRILFWIFFAEFIGIFFATIFLRYHYVIDIVAGFLFFYLAVRIGNRLEKSFHY